MSEEKKEEKPKRIKDLTITELKAAAFDRQIDLHRIQDVLNAIVAEIQRKQENGQE